MLNQGKEIKIVLEVNQERSQYYGRYNQNLAPQLNPDIS